MDNLLLTEQNIYTLTPLLFSTMIALMVVTKMWKQEFNTMLFLIANGVCSSMYMYGYIEETFYVLDAVAVVVVLMSFIRKRKKICKEKR